MAKIKIMLDAGHYGSFYNASPVVSTYYESNMTWSLTGYLKDELEKLGFEVGLTRYEKDLDLGLVERGLAAQGYNLFLSIHSNAASSEAPDAPWLIHFSPEVMGGNDILYRKSLEAAKVLGNTVSRIMGVSEPFYYTKTTEGFDRDGDGKVNDEYYGVLYGSRLAGVAGVIVEHSFHTNRKAATWLSDETNLKTLAKAEAAALADYFNLTGNEDDTVNDEKFAALEKRVETIEKVLYKKYDSLEECPAYSREAIGKLIDKGFLKGDGNGKLNLSEDMIRIFTVLDRAGVI